MSIWAYIVAVSTDEAHVALNSFMPRLGNLPVQALACVVNTLTGPLPGQPIDKIAPTESLLSLARATGGDVTSDLVGALFERVVRITVFFNNKFIYTIACHVCM